MKMTSNHLCMKTFKIQHIKSNSIIVLHQENRFYRWYEYKLDFDMLYSNRSLNLCHIQYVFNRIFFMSRMKLLRRVIWGKLFMFHFTYIYFVFTYCGFASSRSKIAKELTHWIIFYFTFIYGNMFSYNKISRKNQIKVFVSQLKCSNKTIFLEFNSPKWGIWLGVWDCSSL